MSILGIERPASDNDGGDGVAATSALASPRITRAATDTIRVHIDPSLQPRQGCFTRSSNQGIRRGLTQRATSGPPAMLHFLSDRERRPDGKNA
jgi:hypothetical protein